MRRLLVMLGFAWVLAACGSSQPSSSDIQAYIEKYQVAHDYKVLEMEYKIDPEQGGESGVIQVSGKLELREPLYVEDLGNQQFRKSVEKMLRRNRFSEREIKHEIYDRVIRATARVPGTDNQYYTFLTEQHAPGYAINFSAELIYKKGNDGFLLDGPVRHPKLQGAQIIKFTNPVEDSTQLVERAVKNVIAEQTRYREMMKDSSSLISRLWDNEYGLVIWNRKVPFLGNENLSADERSQLNEFTNWRGVFRISNIRPIQFRMPHASNFFELGRYTTQGVATCLRQTGFVGDLIFAKADYDQYCEFGKQYPVRIEIASILNETNEFEASVSFEINGASSGELVFESNYFQREQNELARYSDQQRVVLLKKPFDLKSHARPQFDLLSNESGQEERLRLKYLAATDYQSAGVSAAAAVIDNSVKPEMIEEPAQTIAEKPVLSDSIESNQTSPNEAKQTVAAVEEKVTEPDLPAPQTPLTKKELVKAIQTELKRLGIYTSAVDGVAGEHTFWAMQHAQNQLQLGDIQKPSPAFLSALVDAPKGSIVAPKQGFKPSTKRTIVKRSSGTKKASSEKEPKGTIAGNALKGTARWIGGLFGGENNKNKKESRPKNGKKN